MKRASEVISEPDRASLRDAIQDAERSTSGELVCVLATQSGDYDRAEDLMGLWLGVGLLAAAWWLMSAAPTGEWGPAELRVTWVELLFGLGLLFGGFVLGAALAARVGWLRRLLTTEAQMEAEVVRAADRVYFQRNLGRTRARTGVLIYLSLFERRVRIVGDAAIAERLGDGDFVEVRDAILAGLRGGSLADGLRAGIRLCGEKLSRHFPRSADDRDELSNELILLD
ncbi:MAG: hypothetical protein GYA21_10300 [Myxococcales bacterium]|nr:hypothetical protein [Myxococcales bacterium]